MVTNKKKQQVDGNKKQKIKQDSAKKAEKQSLRKHKENKATQSRCKVALRECIKGVADMKSKHDVAQSQPNLKCLALLSRCYSALDKAFKKKVFSRNKVNRYKSRMARLINA